MAVKTKAQLYSDIAALPTPITRVSVVALWQDMIDSWENVIVQYTTAQRDAITPVLALKIFNTTNSRMEFYNGTAWIACSQKPTVAVNCSTNPNYQEGSVGDLYIVSVAGKIGGASGKTVYVGDLVYCITKNAGGTEASVGASWMVSRNTSNITLTTTPTWFKVASKTFADLSAAALTNDISIYTLPARGVINDARILQGTNFSGGAIASYSLAVGIVGGLRKYQDSVDVFTGSVINTPQDNKTGIESISATTDIRLEATSSVANLDAATAGTVDVFLLLSILPS